MKATTGNHARTRTDFSYRIDALDAIIACMHTRLQSILRIARGAVVATTMLCVAGLTQADPDAEREVLARLIHEIQSLEPMIATAESQSLPDARIRFRYDWLRRDLRRIREGVQDHVDAPRNEPRRFPPLRGDYRQ